eukprot:NODE_5151_length_598_cov_54.134791_g4452_i0.p2 GENE.NODE_5151_length_598_cov_54.134791_g4452_i0~~NODE_5151_length_598_cov_54.134791_g4452_i0.p2  ORF type:complete len:106 (+),score=24.76 NODE_5151_length_598_cov_54.134791_g4452_i0:22-318(+)
MGDSNLVRRVPEHHRTPLVRALQEIVISYDMMSTIKRSTMVTVMEVVCNTHWLIAMARSCINSGKVPLSRMPRRERHFTFDAARNHYRAKSAARPFFV